MGKIYLGDIPQLKIDAGQDISAATSLRIYYKKPDGEIGYWTGTLSGTNYVVYQTEVDDIDQTGLWTFQVYMTLSAWTGHGDSVTRMVHELFK